MVHDPTGVGASQAPERQLHEALQRTKGAVSDALVGCVVASRRKRVRGIFGQAMGWCWTHLLSLPLKPSPEAP